MAVKYSASDLNRFARIYSKGFNTVNRIEDETVLTEVAQVRGKLMPMPGRERMRADQLADTANAMFVIRTRDWLTENHVILIRGTYYEIHSIVDVEGRERFQEILISETENKYEQVIPLNAAPVAAFTFTANLLELEFTDASTDSDGTVTAWRWNFGDGFQSTLQNPAHTYTAAGTYTVELTAVDDKGAENTTSQTITVSQNAPPVSAFTFAATLLDVDFTDASTDSDGTVVSWAWDFGDTNTSSAQNPSHTFAAAGTYTVELTVTDDLGATGVSSQEIEVADSLVDYPSVQSVLPGSTTAASTTGGTSLDIAMPPTENIDAGDDMVVLVGIDRDNATGTAMNNGFNLLRELYISAGSGSIYAALFHKIATGAESGNATITFGNAANDGAAAVLLHARGSDGNASPLSSIIAGGTGGNPAAPGNVLDAEKYLVFNLIVADSNGNVYDTDPAGFTNRHNSGNNGTSVSLIAASNEIDGDGASTFGNEAHTITAGRECVALSIALKGG